MNERKISFSRKPPYSAVASFAHSLSFESETRTEVEIEKERCRETASRTPTAAAAEKASRMTREKVGSSQALNMVQNKAQTSPKKFQETGEEG